MRTQQVATNLSCNQNCTYCTRRAASDDPRFIATAAVLGRIRDAAASGVVELVLTGGEPALRKDLARLVREAKAAGVERVRLDTNATLITAATARALAEAGLGSARVNAVGLGADGDDITRDENGWARTRAGIGHLIAAGIPIEISTAVITGSLATLPSLPRELVDAFGAGAITGIYVTVPHDSPDDTQLVEPATAAAAIADLERRARGLGIPLKLMPGSGPPPCTFDRRGLPAHVYSLTRGAGTRPEPEAWTRVPACETCAVADRCPGFARATVERFGTPDVEPIVEDRMRRRLSLIASVSDQVERELVTPSLYRGGETGEAIREDIVRVNFHCNQRCRFCFVSTHLPAAEHERIVRAIEDSAQNAGRIVISGGEPTLNPRLSEYVALAFERTGRRVDLQTNAIRLDDRALAESVVAAGVGSAFVSLHGSTADVCDDITAAPGTWARSVVGLDNLHDLGVHLTLNFVICARNAHDLTNWVRLLSERWPKAVANISFVAPSTDVVPRDRDLIPRYADVLPHLGAAMVLAADLGVTVTGFESMCGLPLCLVPEDGFRELGFDEVPEGFDEGEFRKPDPCQRCSLRDRCFGLRSGYLDLYGHDELRPVP